LGFLVFKKYEFRIVNSILTKEFFTEWIGKEGKIILNGIFQSKKCRWFFGWKRARRTLFRSARKALNPQAPFVILLAHHLNQMPIIIRNIGLIIKRKKYKDLYSADSTRALVVIPRGIVQNDFTRYLLNELTEAPQLEKFLGLSSRILKKAASDAERVLFHFISKGGTCPDPEGQGILMEADSDYGWKLNGMNGHYYYAYYGKRDNGLSKKKLFNQFKAEMEEILYGQKIHLRRLESHQVFDIAETFRGRR
jgi:hypothetical protein